MAAIFREYTRPSVKHPIVVVFDGRGTFSNEQVKHLSPAERNRYIKPEGFGESAESTLEIPHGFFERARYLMTRMIGRQSHG